MAVSFGTKNESVPNHPISNQPEILENNANAINDDERPCDMEMDCAMATEDHGALQVPEPHIDDTWYVIFFVVRCQSRHEDEENCHDLH